MTKLTRYKFTGDKLTQLAPQLAQEIKTRVKLKNILAVLVAAIACQFALVVLALGKLPDISYPELAKQEQFSRYCTGALTHLSSPQQQLLCIQNLDNHWLINWQLFWFDIFTIISILSILLLILGGTYQIIANLSKEQQQETLTLITLAPQPARQLFVGKIIGVPILLYGFLALCLPLNLVAGLQSGIPLSLMIAFYLATIISCAFFYNLGLLVVYQPASNTNFVSNRVVTIIIAIASFLLLTTHLNHNSNHQFGNIGDWLLLCNPLNLILYLGQITAIPFHYFNYESFDLVSELFTHSPSVQLDSFQATGLGSISFYGQSLRNSPGLGLGLVTANFLIGAYWFWQVIKRRFANYEQSPINKEQSYWLSFQIGIFALGLTLTTSNTQMLSTNFSWLSCFLLIYAMVLIFNLSSDHYALRDWLHNRKADLYDHNQDNSWQSDSALNPYYYSFSEYSFWQDLLFGESSPANLAIALNLLIIACYLIPALIIFSSANQVISMLSQLILQLSLILLVATLWQWLKLKYHRNQLKNRSLLLLSAVMPVAIATNFNLLSATNITGTIAVALGIFGQWLAIILVTTKTLKALNIHPENLNIKLIN